MPTAAILITLCTSLAVAGRGQFEVMDLAAAKKYVPAARGIKLRIESRLVSPRAVEWRVAVEASDGADHCVSVRYAVPVDAIGWRWDVGLGRQRKIVEGVVYEDSTPTRLGLGTMARWPLASISSGNRTMALAVRIDEPAIYRFQYDAKAKRFCIAFDFALTAQCRAWPRRATFRFYELDIPNGWGLRAALDEYYRLFSELFVVRPKVYGGWFAWGDVLNIKPPLCDFGLRFHEQPSSAKALAHNRALGILSFKYIEPGMHQQSFADFDHAPTRADVLERLRYNARADVSDRVGYVSFYAFPGMSKQEALRRMAVADLASGLRDERGELIIGRISRYHWIPGSRWAAQIPLNCNPAIPNGAGQFYLEFARVASKDRAWGDGQYLDSLSAYMMLVDFAPAHVAVSSRPPCFDGRTRKPALLMAWGMFDYVEALARLLHPQGQFIITNLYSAVPYPYHCFDQLGKEHWVVPTGRLMQLYRAMAYRKCVSDLPGGAPPLPAKQFFRAMLLYDVFPGGYARRRATREPEQWRAEYREVVPLLRMLAKLGWEPVTQARCDVRTVQIERYGRAPGPVAFVLFNRGNPRRVVVHWPQATKATWYVESLDDRPVHWDGREFTLALGTNETALVVAGDTAAHRKWLRMRAAEARDDLDLCRREAQMGRDTAARSAELRKLIDRLERAAATLRPAKPRPVPEPPKPAPPKQTFWEERFDGPLSLDRWEPMGSGKRTEVVNGRLELELAKTDRHTGIVTRSLIDFSTQPVLISADFQYNHGPGPHYLMMAFLLQPSRGSNDFLRVRIDNRGADSFAVRVENWETPATNYQKALTPWVVFKRNRPHHLSLRLDTERFELRIDGRLVGRGLHDCEFTAARLAIELYSGHRGHGDVCWVDNLKVAPAR